MIQNTINWYNGEIFEAKFILSFGLILILVAIFFYFLGNTPAAKALLIPFLVLALLFVAIGGNMIFSNTKKLTTIEQQYNANPVQFQQDEIKRVENFQYLYPMSIAFSLGSFLVALGLLYFVKNIHWQAIAIALILFGTAFAVIDYFSKERANIYYSQLKSIS